MVSPYFPLLLIPILLLYILRITSRSRKRFPPGPAGLPIFGNYWEIRAGHWNEKFNRWRELYGDIVCAWLPGSPVYIINSYKLAEETVGKGLVYTGRPYSHMTQNLMGWGWNVGLMSPSKEWSQYRPLIHNEIVQHLKALVDFEGHAEEAINSFLGTIIIRLAYGNEIFEEHGQCILDTNRDALRFLVTGQSTLWFVDIFPLLQYIPSWLPGAGFQKLAQKAKKKTDYLRFRPWEFVLEKLKRPEGYEECIATRMIKKDGATGTLRDAIAVMYVAGTDTTAAVIVVFLLCMVLHPESQRRVHDELDRVVGQDRLPTQTDFESLVYLQAAWKEAMRWHSVTPIGVVRETTEDQVVQGYWIPKGSRVYPHTGFMLRDPSLWEEPEVYSPDRFLVPAPAGRPDPSISFGYGRRYCPGKYFAEEVGKSTAAALMWAFRVESMERPATPHQAMFLDGSMSPALPFKVRFRPRSNNIRNLIVGV